MSLLADTGLPIEAAMEQIRHALAGPGIGVLTAEPGAGKTTIVPLRLLDQPWLAGQKILVLEPRRVAARAVARRMASLLGESVGATVGWRTRDDRRVGPETRIEVITEGILTRQLQRDPSLPGVGAVLFDEFHERSVHADLGLALALEAREAIRDDLRILVMSATIDAEAVANLVGGTQAPAPVIDCPGRSFPIDVYWSATKPKQRIEQATADAVVRAFNTGPPHGDVLVFMPGRAEIRRTIEQLVGRVDAEVLPLYGALDPAEQDAALRAIPGKRRVVVSTDVAETSLTVDGITAVVDAGLARRPRYDPATGLSRLVTVPTSKASSDQRAGRAGRLGPGKAFRLWSKVEHAARPRHDKPEILETDLTSVMLEALAWGIGDLSKLRLLDQPSDAAVTEATQVLALLGATDADGRITDQGRRLLRLPVHPRLAAMVDRSAGSSGQGPMAWPAAILAALLTERDVIGGRRRERPVDLWPRVQLIADRQVRHPNTDVAAVQNVRRRAEEILSRAGGNRSAPVHPGDLGRTLALAYPDRIAQLRPGRQGGRFRLRNGMGGEINVSDPMAQEPMLVVAEISGPKRKVSIGLAAAIDPLDVELGFSDEVVERRFLSWDEQSDDLRLRVERRLGSLDFGTHDQPVEPSEAVTEALIERIVKTKLAVLAWSKRSRDLQQRVAFIIENGVELDQSVLPIDDETLIAKAETIFGPWLPGATGRASLETLDLYGLLVSRLGPLASQLDRLAPIKLTLVDGSALPISYESGTPKVSGRAQRFYGMTTTPTVLNATVPITVELLSPADRPIQTTADLANFWSGSWNEVRKEMAGRYPKHNWPQDPTTYP